VSKEKVRRESSEETPGSELELNLREQILIAWNAGKTPKEIVEETGLPIQQVYKSLQHIQKKVAKKHAFFIPPSQKAKLKSALSRKRNKKKFVREGQVKNLTYDVVDKSPSRRDPGEGQIDMPREDLNLVTISASEFEQLSAKTAEILEAAAVAYERIAIDQEEIEQLKTETRALLAGLRAA
jgi:hypothetical protein